MKVSNTRAVTGLYIASGKNDPLHIGGIVGGAAVRICSLPAHLNGGKTPSARELRGIIEGRSVVAAAPWTAVDGTAFDAIGFGVTSAELAIDTAGEFDSLIAAVAAHRENVADTIREYDRAHLTAAALAAFDARVAALSPMYAHEGVTVERDSTAGDNGGLVDVSRVLDAGAVIGHVFAAVNPARGQVQFKAQANGGALVAWDRDFIGAVRSLVAHARMAEVLRLNLSKAANINDVVDASAAYVAHVGGVVESAEDIAQRAVAAALEQTPGNAAVSLTLDYPGAEQGYVFVMVGPKNGQGVRPSLTLSANGTSPERLAKHWAGFAAYHGAQPADVVRAGPRMVVIAGDGGAVNTSGLPAYPAPRVDLRKPAMPAVERAPVAVDPRSNLEIMESHRAALRRQREASEEAARPAVAPLYYIAKTGRDGKPMPDAWARVSRATYDWNMGDGWPVRMESTGAQYLATLAAVVQA